MSANNNAKKTIYELIKIYTPIQDVSFLKEITPLFTCAFLVIYSLLLITDGYYFLVFLFLGFAAGAFYFNSHDNDGNLKIEQYQRNLLYTEQTLEQFSNSTEPEQKVELFYPPLTIVVNQLLDYVMRDFVLSWWTPINLHNDKSFEKLARERLNVVFLNVQKILLNQERNDIVMSTLYGLANTLIIHMRECRDLEDSGLSMKYFVIENPQSPFSQLLSEEEQHQQLLALSQTFLKRTLPAQDRDSLIIMSLLKELLATYVFGSLLDNLSEPDFLNCWIIDLLSSSEETSKEAITSTISAAVLAEQQQQLSETEESSSPTEQQQQQQHQVTPPDTPESQRVNQLKPIKKIEDPTVKMVFPKGSVNFTIMDISAPQENEQSPNKIELVYIIQIERPAMEDQLGGSEGGGYVITRTYADFEAFYTILCARHVKRATKLQLKLPLDNNTAKSWLKSSLSQGKKKKLPPLDTVSGALEQYINVVVQDVELGTDNIILPFLRKERRSEIGDGGVVVSFAEEFQEETKAAYASLVEAGNGKGSSRSLFSRNSTGANGSPSLSNTKQQDIMEERHSMDQQDTKWFAPKRTGSISSMHSQLSKLDSPIEYHDEEKLSVQELEEATTPLSATPQRRDTPSVNKALSAMDVELLIETTYALIVETFNLTSTNNKAWMRRSILNLLREIVRRTYAEFISEQYSDFVNEYMSPDAIVGMLNTLGEQFWPEGKWMSSEKELVKRTEEDKEKSKELARIMLMSEVIPNAVRQLIGDQNCNTAMDRIWARIQDPELNRVLILQVLERIIKPILG